MCNLWYMATNNKWITIKIPRPLREAYDTLSSHSHANFAQFTQYAIRKELERMEGVDHG